MKKENRWILATVAVVMIVINLVNADFSAFQNLSPTDYLPVIVIAVVIFLAKTGVLSAILIGLKQLWDWLRKK